MRTVRLQQYVLFIEHFGILQQGKVRIRPNAYIEDINRLA